MNRRPSMSTPRGRACVISLAEVLRVDVLEVAYQARLEGDQMMAAHATLGIFNASALTLLEALDLPLENRIAALSVSVTILRREIERLARKVEDKPAPRR